MCPCPRDPCSQGSLACSQASLDTAQACYFQHSLGSCPKIANSKGSSVPLSNTTFFPFNKEKEIFSYTSNGPSSRNITISLDMCLGFQLQGYKQGHIQFSSPRLLQSNGIQYWFIPSQEAEGKGSGEPMGKEIFTDLSQGISGCSSHLSTQHALCQWWGMLWASGGQDGALTCFLMLLTRLWRRAKEGLRAKELDSQLHMLKVTLDQCVVLEVLLFHMILILKLVESSLWESTGVIC